MDFLLYHIELEKRLKKFELNIKKIFLWDFGVLSILKENMKLVLTFTLDKKLYLYKKNNY
jgi:hypothetical protein